MSKPISKPDGQRDAPTWRDVVPEERLAHLVQDARKGMERALQIRLGDHAVSFGHWSFLRVLWDHDGLTQRQLSETVGLTAPTTSAAINAMEALGYVERRQRSDNRKNVYVFLTKKGRALKARLLPLAEEVNALAVDGLDESEVAVARKVLMHIVGNLVEDEQRLLHKENKRVLSTRELGRLRSA